MATINLGSIKFKWQGAYAGGTAYTVDDVVSYQGSSYICIQASTGNLPTNATYWEQMSQKGTDGTNGTDGTDLGTTLTTQGDIVYRDASGLQRLGAGTSGQVLQTGGSGANPSWGTLSSDYVKVASGSHSGQYLYVDNCFTTDYELYKVYFYNIDAGSYMRVRMRTGGASGVDYAGAKYRYRTRFWFRDASTAGDTGEAGWNDTSYRIGYSGTGGSANGHTIEMNLSEPTSTSIMSSMHGHRSETGSLAGFANFGGYANDSQSSVFTGIMLFQNSTSSFNCDYAIYGMKV